MSARRKRQNAETVLRRQICEIGRRLYARGYVAGSDGNISCRLGRSALLCTPTLISKGFMTPADLCKVDLNGKLLSGRRQPTSEVRLHIAVYRADPAARAVIHCHSPYALALAVCGVRLPRGVLPEVEIFLGSVPTLPYETPGSAALAEHLRRVAAGSCAALLANHGVVTWAEDLERAWWYTEILEAYCRVLILARSVGRPRPLPADKLRELEQLRQVVRGQAWGKTALPGAELGRLGVASRSRSVRELSDNWAR